MVNVMILIRKFGGKRKAVPGLIVFTVAIFGWFVLSRGRGPDETVRDAITSIEGKRWSALLELSSTMEREANGWNTDRFSVLLDEISDGLDTTRLGFRDVTIYETRGVQSFLTNPDASRRFELFEIVRPREMGGRKTQTIVAVRKAADRNWYIDVAPMLLWMVKLQGGTRTERYEKLVRGLRKSALTKIVSIERGKVVTLEALENALYGRIPLEDVVRDL